VELSGNGWAGTFLNWGLAGKMTDTSGLVFSRGRAALKAGFRQLGFKRDDKVLVPDFICEALIHPILQLGLVPVYYPVALDLAPDWQALEFIASNSNHTAIIMVHYFGQPQDVERFREFSDRHNMALINDNGHGHGGEIAGRPLGAFGDIGISSPRKFIEVPSGGCLYGIKEDSFRFAKCLARYPIFDPKSVAKALLYLLPPLWRLAKSWAFRNREWGNPYFFREPQEPDRQIDVFSRWRIKKTDWKKIASERRKCWCAWQRFLEGTGLILVFSEVHPESCPLALPVYARDLNERNRWLVWGVKNKIPLYSWPSLPECIIAEKGSALVRWKMLVCFPLDVFPPEDRESAPNCVEDEKNHDDANRANL
jgi:perosamine synthetase